MILLYMTHLNFACDMCPSSVVLPEGDDRPQPRKLKWKKEPILESEPDPGNCMAYMDVREAA